MLTLGLESSTRLGSVALGEDDALLAESSLSVRATHSETVMPEVRRLLRRAGRGARELDRVVAGAGPGSFTGVRIAASLARGLCAATGAELLAYSSLAALAAGTGLEGPVCGMLDARRGQVYALALASVRPLAVVAGPVAAPVEEVLDRLDDPSGWTFAGEGALAHRARIEDRGGRVLSFLHAAPRAAALLELAREQPDAGRVEEPADWEPQYVRASGARRGIGG